MPVSSQTSFRITYFAVFSLLQLFLVQFARAQNPEIPILKLNKPIERELAGGQKHEFQLAPLAGQYAKIVIEQRGVDVVARLTASDGKTLVEFDADPRLTGTETVEFTSADAAAGNFRLTVEPRQKSAAAGRYQILLVETGAATEKDFALDEARRIGTEVTRLWRAGDYGAALPLAQKVLEIREKQLGAEHPDYGQALFALANVYSDLTDFEKSEKYYLRAIEIREKALGKDHFSLSSIYNNLAVLYREHGDLVKAESLLKRTLEIREKTLDANHLLIASVLNNLAGIARQKGDFDKSAEFYGRVLKIRESALGAENADVATTLNNIANIYADKGEWTKAEPLYRRSLATREKVLPPEHREIGEVLHNLGRLYTATGYYAKALPYGERALTIIEKSLGAEHWRTSYPLNLLGIIYKNTGEYEKSEISFQRTIAIKEKTLGEYHPDLGGSLASLADLYALKGETEKAVAAQTRANAIYEYNAALNLTTGSEREKLLFLQTQSNIENQTLTLNFRVAPDSAAFLDLALTATLQRKGRVLDVMSNNLGRLRQRFSREDQKLLDDLNDATTRLVGAILGGAGGLTADEFTKKIKQLQQERENIESRISRQSAGFYEQTKTVTIKEVQNLIPQGAVLVEFVVYRPVAPKSLDFGFENRQNANSFGSPHYAVFVLSPNGAAHGRDLGETKDIDAAINAFRTALRDPKRGDVKELGRALDEKILSPLRPFLNGAKQLLVSPDGALNLIPFEALVDAQGNYLVENYAVSYLTSGRDLLRMQIGRESKNKPLVVANPTFGSPKNEKPKTASARTRSITAARDLSDVYFAPLVGTELEARSIKTIFPEAIFLDGAAATETALKQTVAPKILHVATHGFFLEDALNADLPSAIRGLNGTTKTQNPLFRSGLALAGANSRNGGSENDGILTALEASGLNLWGTKLVVLSACDTGLGEIRNGEGVYGLRRAFVLAGAETLVMSLWSISDYVTRELMIGYYKNLKKGVGRGEALRRVQLEMLKKPTRRHPFYWASFIQSGNWTNLDNKH